MKVNVLSKRQELSEINNLTEGTEKREMAILLLTTKKNAYDVINKGRFTRENWEFGPGYYFVQTLEESEGFYIEDRAVVLCQVHVGVSLILTDPNRNLNEKTLKSKSANSVKGYLNLSQFYYVVYNYKQIKKIIALKADEKVVRQVETLYKCTNHLCKMHGDMHEGVCSLMCYNKQCRFFNGFHEGSCHLKCVRTECEKFNMFHGGSCRLRCTWENCVMFGKFHENKCIHLEHEEQGEEAVYNKIRFGDLVESRAAGKKKRKLRGKAGQGFEEISKGEMGELRGYFENCDFRAEGRGIDKRSVGYEKDIDYYFGDVPGFDETRGVEKKKNALSGAKRKKGKDLRADCRLDGAKQAQDKRDKSDMNQYIRVKEAGREDTDFMDNQEVMENGREVEDTPWCQCFAFVGGIIIFIAIGIYYN